MIDPKELRIGNYVIDEVTTHVVAGVDKWHVESYWINDKEHEKLYLTSVNQIKPIPLTEDWLIKFGFELAYESYKGDRAFHMKGFDQLSDYGSSEIVTNKDGYTSFICGYYENEINCKHVHQLQNLYFALTGEELTMK